MNKYVVLKNISHPTRGIVKPGDPDPVVDLSHLSASDRQLLIDRHVVALATVKEAPAGDGKEGGKK